MSLVALGPLIQVRGRPASTATCRAATACGTLSTTCAEPHHADVPVRNQGQRPPSLAGAVIEHHRAGLGDGDGAGGEHRVEGSQVGVGGGGCGVRAASAGRESRREPVPAGRPAAVQAGQAAQPPKRGEPRRGTRRRTRQTGPRSRRGGGWTTGTAGRSSAGLSPAAAVARLMRVRMSRRASLTFVPLRATVHETIWLGKAGRLRELVQPPSSPGRA